MVFFSQTPLMVPPNLPWQPEPARDSCCDVTAIRFEFRKFAGSWRVLAGLGEFTVTALANMSCPNPFLVAGRFINLNLAPFSFIALVSRFLFVDCDRSRPRNDCFYFPRVTLTDPASRVAASRS